MVAITEAEREGRRQRVWSLTIAGTIQDNIAKAMGISISTVRRDLRYLEKESQDWVFNLAKAGIGFEFKKCVDALNDVIQFTTIIMNHQNPYRDTPEYNNARPGTFVDQRMKIEAGKLKTQAIIAKDQILRNGPNILAVASLNSKIEELEKQMGVTPMKKFELWNR